jgi:hypothetical protein
LLGYAAQVHERSGAVCQLCGYGKGRQPDFDMWRQLTVEHLIGESQGGYLTSIRASVGKGSPTSTLHSKLSLSLGSTQRTRSRKTGQTSDLHVWVVSTV